MWSSPRERHREVLEQKLCLLIKAGADVNHCNDRGYTPSQYARGVHKCWDEWCRALESCGLDINEVLQADKERRKAFWEGKGRMEISTHDEMTDGADDDGTDDMADSIADSEVDSQEQYLEEDAEGSASEEVVEGSASEEDVERSASEEDSSEEVLQLPRA